MRSNVAFNRMKHKGFTLIETIVGLVVLAVSFSVITTIIYPIAEQSAEQLHQIKAAELGQSMLNEIQSKAFDQNSDMAGGLIRCGEFAVVCSPVMGPEDGNDGRPDDDEDSRDLFNDVDDYNNLIYSAGNIENSQGQVLNLYTGYAISVRVCNDSDYDGDCSTNIDNSTAKLITVIVTTPTNFDIVFATYKVNF
jgi:MSHA pilin protein MshD